MLKIIRHYFSGIKTDLFHSSVLLSGSVVAQTISFFAYPVLTRLYNPTQFGEFSLFLSITGILSIIATGRLEYSLMIPEEDREAKDLLKTGIRWSLIFSGICLFFAGIIGLNKSWTDKIPGLLFIPFAVLFTGMIQFFTFYRNRHKQYKRLAQFSIVQNVSATGGKIAFGFSGIFNSGLISGSIFGQVFSVIFISWKIVTKDLFYLPANVKALIHKYAVFPKYRMVQAVINNFSSNLPIFFIAYYFSVKEAGYVGLVLGISLKIVTMVSSAVYQVLYRRFSEKNDLLPLFLKNASFLFLIAIIPCIVVFSFSKHLIPFVLGDIWLEADFYVKIILPWLLLVFVISPFTFIADMFFLQRKALIVDMIYLIIRLAGLGIGYYFNDVHLALGLYVFGSILVQLYLFAWYFRILKSNES